MSAAGWEPVRLGAVVDEVGGSTPSKDRLDFWDGEVPWVTPKDMKADWIDDSIDHVTPTALEQTSLKLIAPNAVLVVVRGMILAHSVPVAVNRVPVTLNQDMKALRPKNGLSPVFLRYALQAGRDRILALVEVAGHGTCCLRTDLWRRLELHVPPAAVQTAIANFLDEKTAAIDDLIAQKQRLIDLLQEKRTALINRAVTKGLDRTVTMKDSGIPWIGEIPAHWRVLQLRRLILAVEQGWSPDCDSRPADGDEWGVLKSGCTNHGTFNPEENKALPGSMAADPRLEVRHGDVLMSRASGSAAHVGSIAQVLDPPPHLIFSDKTFRITFDLKAVWPSFAVKALGSAAARTQIERAISGAGGLANNLPQSELVEIVVPLPPVNEQRELAGVLEEASRSINGLVKDSEAQIARLQEYRQALITAAVTGKLDVAQETVR